MIKDMPTDPINFKAYEFVDKVRIIKRVNNEPKNVGSLKEMQCVDLSEYEINEIPSFQRVLSPDNQPLEIVFKLNGKTFGFEECVYPHYFAFVKEILKLKEFDDVCTYNFIEEKTLEWIVGVFENKQSAKDLIGFLQNKIEDLIQERIYYFPILNLYVDRPFKIGSIDITYLTKQFFDEFWEKCEYKESFTIEDFDNICRCYQGKVLASVKVKAEFENGKLIALEKCSFAIDILKMFTPTIIFPNRKCLLDLSENINVNFETYMLALQVDKPINLKITKSLKADPLHVTEDVLEFFTQNKIEIFSSFHLNFNNEIELQRLLKQAIKLYSIAISTSDLHFRIAQLVTISESLLLEDELRNNLERKCKQRFIKIVFSSDESEGQIFIAKLSELYQIRHSIMHKAIRLTINLQYLAEFQFTIIDLIQKLIIKSYKIETKSEMIMLIDGN